MQHHFPVVLFAALWFPCFLFSAYLALRYACQPLLEQNPFRQTQTALTSYWFIHDGFRLAYETPVGGYPWSVPFEFPIFQALAAATALLIHAPLDPTGRLLSFAFTVACVVPVRSVARKLALPPLTWFAFAALFFSSPMYLCWGRTYMIETAALFFSLAAIPFFVDLLNKEGWPARLGFCLFASAAILQKSTTELPLLVLLGIVYLWHVLRSDGLRSLLGADAIATLAFCFALPLELGAWWTAYSETVRSANPLGISLNPQALNGWVWGTLAQRSSRALYEGVIYTRILKENLGGFLGALAIGAALVCLPRSQRQTKWVVLFCLAGGMLPLFLFTNLHLIHTYYQTANTAYLIFALAVAVAGISQLGAAWANLAAVGLLAVVGSNLIVFDAFYAPSVAAEFDVYNSRPRDVADVLHRELVEGQSFVAFGNDWSSTFAYYAQRKSFTVPSWFDHLDRVAREPDTFVGDTTLGAIVTCLPEGSGTFADVMTWAFSKGWSLAFTKGCYLAIPDHPPSANLSSVIENPNCEGHIDFIGALIDPKTQLPLAHTLTVGGWTAVSIEQGIVPEQVYLSMEADGVPPVVRRAIRVPRGDVRKLYHDGQPADAGYSLTIDTSALAGAHTLSVLRQVGTTIERCQWRESVTIQ